jgi:hypothetical protein
LPLSHDTKPSQTCGEEAEVSVTISTGLSALESLNSLVGNTGDLPGGGNDPLGAVNDPVVDFIGGSGTGGGSALEALKELIQI